MLPEVAEKISGNRHSRSRRAQTLSELAACGSVLLLTVSLLLRYGLGQITRQRNDMETYMAALNDAMTNPVGESNKIIYQDYHVPNPQDTFGMGDRQTVAASQGVTWTNLTQRAINKQEGFIFTHPSKAYEYQKEHEGNVTYEFNTWHSWQGGGAKAGGNYKLARNGKDKGVNVTYSVGNISNEVGNVMLNIYDMGIIDQPISPTWLKVSIDQATGEKSVRALTDGKTILAPNAGVCEDVYCPTERITQVDADGDYFDELLLLGEVQENGQQLPATFSYWDTQEGDIDLSLASPGRDVVPEKVRGGLATATENDRHDTQIVYSTPSHFSNTNRFQGGQKIIHPFRIRPTAHGADTVVNHTFDFEPPEKTETWTTAK